jgi:hypothetical protein
MRKRLEMVEQNKLGVNSTFEVTRVCTLKHEVRWCRVATDYEANRCVEVLT